MGVTWVSHGCHMTPIRCDYGVGMMYHTALIGWCMRNWSVLNWLSCPDAHMCVWATVMSTPTACQCPFKCALAPGQTDLFKSASMWFTEFGSHAMRDCHHCPFGVYKCCVRHSVGGGLFDF